MGWLDCMGVRRRVTNREPRLICSSIVWSLKRQKSLCVAGSRQSCHMLITYLKPLLASVTPAEGGMVAPAAANDADEPGLAVYGSADQAALLELE